MKNIFIIFISCFGCQNAKSDRNAISNDIVTTQKNDSDTFVWAENLHVYKPVTPSDEKEIITRLNIHELFTDAKWRMYCLYCLSKCKFSDTTERLYAFYDTMTFAELELKLIMLEDIKHELAMHYKPCADYGLYFEFRLPKMPNLDEWFHVARPAGTDIYRCNTLDCYLDNGSMMLQYFKKQQNKPYVLFTSFRTSGIRINRLLYNNAKPANFWEAPDPEVNRRITEPLTPEVVEYIKRNAAKLHPWFYNEAVRRGVIDSVHYPRTAN